MKYSVKKNSNYNKYFQFIVVTPWGLLEDENGVCCFDSKESAEKEIKLIK